MERFLVFVLKRLLTAGRWVKEHPRVQAALRRSASRELYAQANTHEFLLADSVRLDAYWRAIAKHVRADAAVLDLGTGTGILAFFASRQNANPIYAIDHSPFIELARFLADRNSVPNIEFFQTHSREFSPPRKFDVIIHEHMSLLIFNENLVEDLCDVRDRLLAHGGIILPARFDIYFEPISLRDDYRIPLLWEQRPYGIDFGPSREWLQQHPGISQRRMSSFQPSAASFFLCQPEKVSTLDLYIVEPASLPRELRFRKTIIRPGRMDGFCFYFDVIFDDDIHFDTSPFSRVTGWSSFMYRTEEAWLEEGDVLDVVWRAEDLTKGLTWTIEFDRHSATTSSPSAAD